MRKALSFTYCVVFLLFLTCGRVFSQESCFPYIFEPCDKDPQKYECMKVTTTLSSLEGGKFSKVAQEYCFRVESPLFGGPQEDLGLEITADKGILKLENLKEGEEIGGFRFSVNLSEFGQDCDVGNMATLQAPIIVTELGKDYAAVQVVITEVSKPMVDCLLTYDPTDEEHNKGLMLEGELTEGPGGDGFRLVLYTVIPEPPALFPGLEYGDLASVGSPVPLFFDPISKSDLFTLPASGGALTIITALSAINGIGEIASADFEEEFEITPGLSNKTFRRGDVNDDSSVNIADAISLLGHLFGGAPAPSCPDSADANDDGQLNIADAISILTYLFAGGTMPPPGGESCGPDPTEDTLPECNTKSC